MAIDSLVDELDRSYAEAQQRMSDPAVYNDHRQAADAGRRLKELETPKRLADEWRQARDDLEAARGDPELAEMAPEYEDAVRRLEEELSLALVERDPADEKDVIVEVRQGVGGDEAALWAGDLRRMLTRYAERLGLKTETLSTSESEGGGVKETVFAVKGQGAFSIFKFEGGTHRVQRVPETESQGRIHTSTATVAVMPEVEEVEIEIHENDLRVDVMRSTGPGGQSVNTTDSAVRVTHLPTGLVVAMQDEKSQLQNKVKALRVLRARLYEFEREKQQAELAASRRSQIGSGERAEKIRTYNYPESRVTDHRIKVTLHRLDQVLDGDLGELTEALRAEEQRQALAAARPPPLREGHAGARRDERAARRGRVRVAVGRRRDPRRARARHQAVGARSRRLAQALDPRGGHSRDASSRAARRASRSRTCSESGASAGSCWASTGACSCRGRRRRSSSNAASPFSQALPALASSTSAREAARSRSRSRTSIPGRASPAWTPRRARSRSPARTSCGPVLRSSCASGICSPVSRTGRGISSSPIHRTSCSEEVGSLEPEVRDWEPRQALTGVGSTEAVARGARDVLAPSGALVLEVAAGDSSRDRGAARQSSGTKT